jgi:hypothetical protein
VPALGLDVLISCESQPAHRSPAYKACSATNHCFREIVHHGNNAVEGMIEAHWVRPVAMSEARIIGRDEVIVI